MIELIEQSIVGYGCHNTYDIAQFTKYLLTFLPQRGRERKRLRQFEVTYTTMNMQEKRNTPTSRVIDEYLVFSGNSEADLVSS